MQITWQDDLLRTPPCCENTFVGLLFPPNWANLRARLKNNMFVFPYWTPKINLEKSKWKLLIMKMSKLAINVCDKLRLETSSGPLRKDTAKIIYPPSETSLSHLALGPKMYLHSPLYLHPAWFPPIHPISTSSLYSIRFTHSFIDDSFGGNVDDDSDCNR